MKIITTLFILFFSIQTKTSEVSQIIESLSIKDKNIKIILSKPKRCDDCGMYEDIKIIFPNGSTKKYTDLTGDKIFLTALDEGGSQLGQYLHLYKMNNETYFLLLMSQSRPDNKVRIIQIESTDAKVIFQENSFTFHQMIDFDKDGLLDLLKKGGRGEPVSTTHSSYDPYLVYKSYKKGKWYTFKLDEKLSQKWSKENKFLWHGPKYNGNIRVDKSGTTLK